jgi:PAS domain S-box-containing protein
MRNVSERSPKDEAKGVMRYMARLPGWFRYLGYYGLALLFVAAAAILRWALPDALGPTPFLAFYLAWVGAAAFGGLGPGLLATAASWLCVDLLFDPTGSLINFADPTTTGRLVVLLAGGLTVSLVAERMRRGRTHERRQARELARAKQEWERTFDAVPDLIAIIDPQHRILRANRTMAERLGVNPEGCTGLTCYRCVHNLDTPPALCPHDQSLADGREHSVEIYEERLGGYFFITCTPLYDQHGAMIGTVHVAHDITERKRAEEVMRKANELLQEQAEELQTQAEELQMQAEELTTANEELRESEQALRESEEQLRQLNLTLESKVAQRTAEVEHRARQLQKLTLELSQAEDRERKRLAEILHDDLQQVLAAAKFHLGLMKNRAKCDPSLQATVTQIDNMLKDAIEKSRSLSHELSPAVLHHGDFGEILGWLATQVQTKHGLVVHVYAHGQVSSESDAIKTFLYKAAQELLFNVVKHARVNEARIRVRRLRRCVCLSVSDHGRGFDPQTLKRTHGFGLFSLQERVELLGGRMKIKSSKDKGSTFFIVVPDGEPVAASHPRRERPALASRGHPGLPLSGQDAPISSELQGQDAPAATAEPQAEHRLRVLLADDHEIVREGLISLLSEERTIEVVGEAANGREAINLAGELQPDVVIMDVSMPLINGDEATRQIKQLLPNARVVALSMFEDSETIERMHAAGAEAYILKTAPSEDLLAAIRGKMSDA